MWRSSEDAGSRVSALVPLALPLLLAGLGRRSRRLGQDVRVPPPPVA